MNGLICKGYPPPPNQSRSRHRSNIEIGYAYRLALSSCSEYDFSKQPSPPEDYSSRTYTAMNLNSN